MVEVVRNTKKIRQCYVWFPKEGYNTQKRCDICCYIGGESVRNPKNNIVKRLSLQTDLTVNDDTIMSPFSKTTRYDIRRSYKDDLTVAFYNGNQLMKNEELLFSFRTIYEKMYSSKGMNSSFPLADVEMYAKAGCLLLSCIRAHNEELVFHAYISDTEIAQLWLSCSLCRESEDTQFRALLSRANKRLHYEDIVYFSSNGLKIYDWGGVSSFQDPNGIDIFKMSFGGQPIVKYDETVCVSLRMRIIHFLKDSFKLLK